MCCCCLAAVASCCSFGTPTPTQVSLDPVEGKCILMTGHDMHDLHELLKQTEGKVCAGVGWGCGGWSWGLVEVPQLHLPTCFLA